MRTTIQFSYHHEWTSTKTTTLSTMADMRAMRFFTNSTNIHRRKMASSNKVDVEALLTSSQSLLETNEPHFKKWSRAIYDIYVQWRHALFTIPYSDQELLKRCAVCIDALVQAVMDRYQHEKLLASRLPADFVCTAIYAWGRVAPHDFRAPLQAESLIARFNNFCESFERHPDFRKTEAMLSAMVYCWSKANGNPLSPQKTHEWLQAILADSNMRARAPTYNATLRAYARHGLIDQVRHLVNEIPLADRDAYTYENLIRAWLNSGRPESSREAINTLREGIQHGLQREDHLAMANLFGGFMNASRNNPEVCEAALRELINLEQELPHLQILSARHFVISMSAWADNGRPEKAEKLLQLLQTKYEHGNERLQPTYQVSRVHVVFCPFGRNIICGFFSSLHRVYWPLDSSCCAFRFYKAQNNGIFESSRDSSG